jgi:hypothetical protein
MRWDRGIFNGSHGFQWISTVTKSVGPEAQEVQNTVGTMSSEQLQSTRRSTCPKMGVSSHGDLAKIIVFLLRMAVFWRIEMGHH